MKPLNYQYLAEAIPFEKDGKTLLSIGFHMTFYFGDGSTQEKRQAVVTLFDEYRKLCGNRLQWQTHPTTFNWQEIKEEHSPQRWVLENPENTRVWQVCMHGGRSFDESSPYRIDAVGYPIPDRGLSYFSIGFPFDWFADPDKEDPVQLVSRWSNLLKPWHGTAGYTVMPSLHRSLETDTASHVYTLMRRFPGLEYNAPGSHSLYLQNRIKSVNWLTIIQNDFIDQLDGVEALKQAVIPDREILLHHYEGGIVIQAGPYPEIGDVNAKLIPQHYKVVNQVLKPIRVGDQHKPFLGFTEETTQEWLARFD